MVLSYKQLFIFFVILVGVAFSWHNFIESKYKKMYGNSVPVVVAIEKIEPGIMIDEKKIKITTIPNVFSHSARLSKTSDALGRKSRNFIEKGEIILEHHLEARP